MDRQHRRELKHDKFVDEVGALSVRARENQRVLILLTAAAVIVAVGVYGFFFYRSNREAKAQSALASAIQTFESPLIPPAGSQPVPNAKFKTEAERTNAAESQFKALRGEYSGSDAADVAGLYLARIDAMKGDVAGSRKLLEEFVKAEPNSMLAESARYSLYQLRIDTGEAPQVAHELEAEVNKTTAVLPADSLLSLLAHAYEIQGDGVKTKETYRRISTEFPDSPYAVEAQRRGGTA